MMSAVSKTMSKRAYVVCCALGLLLGLNGCSEPVDEFTKEETSHVIEGMSDVEGFVGFYTELEASLFEKKWGYIYSVIPDKSRRYFKDEADFIGYMEKNNRLWELKRLDELSSEVDYLEQDVQQVEIFFQAEVLPGPTRHNASLKFLLDNGEWVVLGLERLRLSSIQFEY